MSDEIEALGGVVTAGIAADALDPATTGATAAHGSCANCGAPLSGAFCPNCGQKAHVHRSLLHVGEEILHGITHFDGKAWTTLPMLVLRPGKLTRAYIEGKRARYIAPVPLFLLVVFLMFFVFSFVKFDGKTPIKLADSSGKVMTPETARRELPRFEARLAEAEAKVTAARGARDTKGQAIPDSPDLGTLQRDRVAAKLLRDRVKALATGEAEAALGITAAEARELVGQESEIDLGNPRLDEKVRSALKNPEFVLYKVQNKAYKLSFLLVPLSLPWLWLMFAMRRDVRMYDHAVFALYSISFMSLLFVAGSLALGFGVTSDLFWVPLLLVPFAHMYAQLKGAYVLGRFGAAWRTMALSTAAIITLVIYAALMILIGVLD